MLKATILTPVLLGLFLSVPASAGDSRATKVLPLPGGQWLSIDDATRHAYVVGFIAGNNSLVSTLGGGILKKNPNSVSKEWIEFHKKHTISENPYEIAKQATFLYQDPANTRIPIESIVGFAIDKTKGIDISKDLAFRRKLARGEIPDEK